jgi:hypothetical protein
VAKRLAPLVEKLAEVSAYGCTPDVLCNGWRVEMHVEITHRCSRLLLLHASADTYVPRLENGVE